MMAYLRDQWIALGIMYSAIMILIASVNLIIPFYPVKERGITPIQFAFLTGGYFLVKCVMCQIVGRYIYKFSIKFTLSAGLFLAGGSIVIFGMLNYIDDFATFLGESYVTYFLTAVGSALVFTSSTTVVTHGYPEDVGAVFAGIHISSGVGQIIGPLAGGALYTYSGFTTTFVVFGSLLLVLSIVATCVFPTQNNDNMEISVKECVGPTMIFRYFRTIKFLVTLFGSVFTVSLFSVSMPFFLDTLFISILLITQSVTYAVSTLLSGWACDRGLSPSTVSVAGSVVTMVSVLLEGADPIIPLGHNEYVQQVLANILLGIGAGAQVVASFTGIWNECLAMGLPDDLSTKGIVSGGWNTIFCVGFFFGNLVCGGLLQMIGDYLTSVTVFIFTLIVFTLNTIDLFNQRIRTLKAGYLELS